MNDDQNTMRKFSSEDNINKQNNISACDSLPVPSETSPRLRRIERQFSLALKTYDQQACVQALMAKRLSDSLRQLYSASIGLENVSQPLNGSPLNVLEVGAGTGLLTREVLQWLPVETYGANDLVGQCRQGLESLSPALYFLPGNAMDLSLPAESFHLILSSAVFQWLSLSDILACTHSWLAPNGILAFATFTQGNLHELAEDSYAGDSVSLKYLSISETITLIEQAGFSIIDHSQFKKTITFDSGIELLRHLKLSGVNAAAPKPWSIKQVLHFCQWYENTGKKPTLTYCPAEFICQKRIPNY